jgi:hypothetical protein
MRRALLGLALAAAAAAAPFVAAQDGSASRPAAGRESAGVKAAGEAAAPDQRPLFLGSDPGLQFTPPPTFVRSVMAGSIVNTGRNLECAITR